MLTSMASHPSLSSLVTTKRSPRSILSSLVTTKRSPRSILSRRHKVPFLRAIAVDPDTVSAMMRCGAMLKPASWISRTKFSVSWPAADILV